VEFDSTKYVLDRVSCNIKDLQVILHEKDDVEIRPLKESPAYHFLISGNQVKYRKYHKLVKSKCKPETDYTIRRFKALLKYVKRYGIESMELIVIDSNFVIHDGQHRASIYKFLGHTTIDVLQIKDA